MNPASFAKNFPPDKDIPDELWELFRYQADVKLGYSGHFRLQDNLWSIPFEDSLRPYFARFACDADGSFYAFWLYQNFSLQLAPIVFLSFGGISNIVLANSFNEFLSLLSLGIDELGYAVQENPGWSSQTSTEIANLRFREWLGLQLKVHPPENPQELVDSAKRRHPDLGSWLIEKRAGARKPRK